MDFLELLSIRRHVHSGCILGLSQEMAVALLCFVNLITVDATTPTINLGISDSDRVQGKLNSWQKNNVFLENDGGASFAKLQIL